MMRRRLPALMVIVLLCLTSGLVFAQDAIPELHAPLYAARGPYSVGRTWLSVSNGTEKPLILVAWYPTLEHEGSQTSTTVTVPDEYDFPDVKSMENSGNWGAAILNAAPD